MPRPGLGPKPGLAARDDHTLEMGNDAPTGAC